MNFFLIKIYCKREEKPKQSNENSACAVTMKYWKDSNILKNGTQQWKCYHSGFCKNWYNHTWKYLSVFLHKCGSESGAGPAILVFLNIKG